MAGGSLDCVSRVRPQTNGRERLYMTLILALPSSQPLSLSPRLWQCSDNDDEYNVLIRSILLRTWTWSRFKREKRCVFLRLFNGSYRMDGSERVKRTLVAHLKHLPSALLTPGTGDIACLTEEYSLCRLNKSSLDAVKTHTNLWSGR